MSLRNLPNPQAFERPAGFTCDMPAEAYGQWADSVHAAEADEANTVSIYDVIGSDFWGEGFTAKRMASALRSVGKNAVTVNINSPGGDMFEGLAIYNLLREHPAKVTVKVMGIAASAASVIAMAGDEILMGTGSVMMIHNAWGMVVGNRHDFADASSVFETFDASMASIYAARTGLSEKEVGKMLDGPTRASDGTYMAAAEAVEKGFADGTFDAPELKDDSGKVDSRRAMHRLDAALAKTGLPRTERRALLASVKGGAPGAAQTVMPGADDLVVGLNRLLNTIRA